MTDIQKLLSPARKAIDHYGMISDGDRIAVGVSGGKDSLTLLSVLNALKGFYPVSFDLVAITIDLGSEGENDRFAGVASFCRDLGIPYTVVKTRIADIVFREKKEKNPCSLCAAMRRGALTDAAADAGADRIALAHHMNDAAETVMLKLIYEGRFGCFCPVTEFEDRGISVIRPLIYAKENLIRSYAKSAGLPVVKSNCPADGNTRSEMKDLLWKYERERRGVCERLVRALESSGTDGWK